MRIPSAGPTACVLIAVSRFALFARLPGILSGSLRLIPPRRDAARLRDSAEPRDIADAILQGGPMLPMRGNIASSDTTLRPLPSPNLDRSKRSVRRQP
jgi:hypothetical protein